MIQQNRGVVSLVPQPISPPTMITNLDPQDRADLARFLREAIEADRYPLSPRVRRLKELLAKVDPTPAPAVMRYPRAAARRRKSGQDHHGCGRFLWRAPLSSWRGSWRTWRNAC